jgi:Rrf2 family protein
MDMPKISQKCRYALRALFELALRDSNAPVNVHDIASAQAIPQRFLEVIFAELKHAGFVEAKRGSRGGYILARPANKIAVGEVLNFLQGRPPSKAAKRGDLPGDYVFSKLWQDVTIAIKNIYNNTTFADLVEQEMANRKKYVPSYAI